jgi:hypothetical protein
MENPMFASNDPLTQLAARVRGGDRAALVGLREQLEPRMTRAVQQVMRTGAHTSPLDRRILRELAGSVRGHCPGASPDRAALVGQVARRLCAAVIARLQRSSPAAALRDTVRDF